MIEAAVLSAVRVAERVRGNRKIRPNGCANCPCEISAKRDSAVIALYGNPVGEASIRALWVRWSVDVRIPWSAATAALWLKRSELPERGYDGVVVKH